MGQHREFFRRMRHGLGMYLARPDLRSLVSFVDGYDHGTGGAALDGFREYMTVRASPVGGTSLGWESYVLWIALPSSRGLPLSALSPEQERTAIETLFDELDAYYAIRARDRGPRRIWAAYEAWLRQQEWYDEDSPSWVATAASPEEILAGPPRRSDEDRGETS